MATGGPIFASQTARPGVRRLSSKTATHDDLIFGPSVVVPPKHLMTPSDAHETAATMEMAKRRISEVNLVDSSPSTPTESTVTDSFAYAFDIDGVLIRGGEPIPEAVEAMKMLNGNNQWGVKVYAS